MIPSFRKTLPGVLFCLALAIDAAANAAPLLRCHIQQADSEIDLQAAPTADPYAVAARTVNRFRFKAVMVGTAQQVDYIALYTYYATGEKAADGAPIVHLLHQAKYLAPQPGRGPKPPSLTGTVYVYEPGLGRELRYDCALGEAA